MTGSARSAAPGSRSAAGGKSLSNITTAGSCGVDGVSEGSRTPNLRIHSPMLGHKAHPSIG